VLLGVDLAALTQQTAQQLARLLMVTPELAYQVHNLRSVEQSHGASLRLTPIRG
jgi:hypothetical protein